MATKKIEQVRKDMKISEVINPHIVQAPPQTTVKDAVKLMQERRSGYIVVVKRKRAMGIFTEKELIFKVMAEDTKWNQPIGEFIDSNPVTLKLSDSIGTAMDTMSQKNTYYISLVDNQGELVNVISVRSVIRFLAAFYPNEVYNLPPRPNQISTSPEGG